MSGTDSVCFFLATALSVRDILNGVSSLLKNMVIDSGATASATVSGPVTSRLLSEGPITRSRKEKENTKVPRVKRTKAEKAAIKVPILVFALSITLFLIPTGR
jgi:hypothetical protein